MLKLSADSSKAEKIAGAGVDLQETGPLVGESLQPPPRWRKTCLYRINDQIKASIGALKVRGVTFAFSYRARDGSA